MHSHVHIRAQKELGRFQESVYSAKVFIYLKHLNLSLQGGTGHARREKLPCEHRSRAVGSHLNNKIQDIFVVVYITETYINLKTHWKYFARYEESWKHMKQGFIFHTRWQQRVAKGPLTSLSGFYPHTLTHSDRFQRMASGGSWRPKPLSLLILEILGIQPK